jgi:hypothetical protein
MIDFAVSHRMMLYGVDKGETSVCDSKGRWIKRV